MERNTSSGQKKGKLTESKTDKLEYYKVGADGLLLPCESSRTVHQQHLSQPLVCDRRQTTSEIDLPLVSPSKHWAIQSGGFPPGVTVDELRKYRRKRPPLDSRPQDNLKTELGSLKLIKSEYKKRYQSYSTNQIIDCYRTERRREETDKEIQIGNKEQIYKGEYKEKYKDFPRERPRVKKPIENLKLDKNSMMEMLTEKNDKFIHFLQAERAKLIRRNTALKPEGNMESETEVRSQYKYFENPPRTYKVIQEPCLKLEGCFEDFSTENREKYLGILSNRKELVRRKTELVMDGTLDYVTENNAKFVKYDRGDRVQLRKRSTSLKLEGELEYFPEYKFHFVDFPRKRPIVLKPIGNLRNEGDFDMDTETRTKFVGHKHFDKTYPIRHCNNINIEGEFDYSQEYKEKFVQFPVVKSPCVKPDENLKPEGAFESLTEKNEKFKHFSTSDFQRSDIIRRPDNLRLEGDLDFLTEKKENFVPSFLQDVNANEVHGKSGVEKEKDTDNDLFGFVSSPNKKEESSIVKDNKYTSSRDILPTPRRREPLEHLSKDETATDMGKTKYVEFPETRRQRSNINRPMFGGDSYRKTEKSSQYISYGVVPKESILKRKENLKLEGPMEIEAEYKSSFKSLPYCAERKSKPCDNLRYSPGEDSFGVSSREKLNNYKSFQVIKNKTLPTCQRSNETNLTEASEVGGVDETQPSFRLEVHNVDQENLGFHRNKERIFPSEPVVTRSISPDYYDKRRTVEKAARTRAVKYKEHNSHGGQLDAEDGNTKSFVILDKEINNNCLNLPSNESQKIMCEKMPLGRDIK